MKSTPINLRLLEAGKVDEIPSTPMKLSFDASSSDSSSLSLPWFKCKSVGSFDDLSGETFVINEIKNGSVTVVDLRVGDGSENLFNLRTLSSSFLMMIL